MSMFHEARDFTISTGNFHITNNQYGRSGIDILREASSPGAAMDSREHFDRRCFPGTREQYIVDITNWATESVDTRPSIYWMRGPAGVGKSAIAQTCAEKLESAGYLAAAFFFTIKKNDRPLRLFTTIAYQLATTHLDYRAILDNKISMDKTIVEKKLSSQFKWLIVEPLQELKKQGKGIGRRTVFIDGLDECAGEDAQAEIIEVIASSVRDDSTPLRWAIFSRSEPRIVSTFNQDDIASLTHSVELPISRKADGEIELYLRGEFKNILQRQNSLQLSLSWPTNEDIKTLVNAAAGLFAHPAAVLRFVSHPLDWQFMERLQAVLGAILRPGESPAVSSLAQLDALYLLIMSRIPDDILLSAQLLLYWAADLKRYRTGPLLVTSLCSELGFSESVFRRICHHLHAVIAYREFPEPLSSLDPRIDLTRSFYDQGQWFQLDSSLKDVLFEVQGLFTFYHKSFHDFLIDPARSSTFCVTTFIICEHFYNLCIQRHHYFASDYVIRNSKLVPAPGVVSSSTSLSWPQGTELVDSFLKLEAFHGLSLNISHDQVEFSQFLEDVSLDYLQKFSELDYRKGFLAEIMLWEEDPSNNVVVGHSGVSRLLPHTYFDCLHKGKFDAFKPTVFLAMVGKLEKAGVIRPYHPRLGSSRAASILHTISGQKSHDARSGLYKYGHGDKSIIWYWEFDTRERYFHEFRTINYVEAVKYYKENKFTMWEGLDDGSWDEDDGEDDDEGEYWDDDDWEGDDGMDWEGREDENEDKAEDGSRTINEDNNQEDSTLKVLTSTSGPETAVPVTSD